MSAFEKSAGATLPAGHREARGAPGVRLKVAVVFTTPTGTLRALRTAAELAQSLNAQVSLLAVEVVPRQLPMDQPVVQPAFLEHRLKALVDEVQLCGADVQIEICLGRERKQCLRQILPARSLVVVGGRDGLWSRERRLQDWLIQQGHQVIMVHAKRWARFTGLWPFVKRHAQESY